MPVSRRTDNWHPHIGFVLALTVTLVAWGYSRGNDISRLTANDEGRRDRVERLNRELDQARAAQDRQQDIAQRCLERQLDMLRECGKCG